MAQNKVKIVPNDKKCDVVGGKTVTEAEFPAVGNEPKTESHNGSKVPDGKGGAEDAK